MTAISSIPTRRFIVAAALIAVAAGGCDMLDRLFWPIARPLSHLFDVAALVLFWLAYVLFMIFLIVGPFRPRTVFSLHGDCGLRVANFILALGFFVLLNLWPALNYLFA